MKLPDEAFGNDPEGEQARWENRREDTMTEAREVLALKPDQRAPITHELKTWQSYFHAINDGSKLFEIRKDDRDFRVGDTLWLRETEYGSGNYTGREAHRLITYVLRHEEDLGLMPGYALLSLDPPVPPKPGLREALDAMLKHSCVADTPAGLRLSREEVEQALADACRGGPDRMTLAQDWLTLHDKLEEAERALAVAKGYLLNAKIDLETGAPKRTAIDTLAGGIRTVEMHQAALKDSTP